MIWFPFAVALVFALITPSAVLVIDWMYRPAGQFIDVDGARLHVVDIGPSSGTAIGPPIVLVHGASSNLESMRRPLGEMLSVRHRVILIDRPGHGFSTRARLTDSTPAIQADMIDAALGKMGVSRAIVVVHSWAGALGAALALDHPARVAGLVMLAPVTHPWTGGVAWYNTLATRPIVGWLFTRLVTTPVGLALMNSGARSAFVPQAMPEHYVRDTALALLMRPAEFSANAYDLVTLKSSVAAMAGRYHDIAAPVTVISGDQDTTVSINIHSRRFVAEVPHARLIVLPGVGHLPQNAAPDIVVKAIEGVIQELAERPAAAAG